jgi:hypothetical protein
VTGRRGRRRKKLLNDRKEMIHLKEEAVDRTIGELALEEALNLS